MTECMPISAPPIDYKLDRPGTSGKAVGPEMAILDAKGKGSGPEPGVVLGFRARACPSLHLFRPAKRALATELKPMLTLYVLILALFPDGWPGEEVEPGVVGNICVRGAPLMPGYEGNEKANQ